MKSAFDLKSARLEAFTLRLFTADLAAIAALLDEKAAQYAKFANMPFILDATRLNRADALDWAALLETFAAKNVRVVALKHAKKDWSEQARAAGLLWLDDGKKANRQPENKAGDVAQDGASQTSDDVAAAAQAGEQAAGKTATDGQPENNRQPENAPPAAPSNEAADEHAEPQAAENNTTQPENEATQPETQPLPARKTVVVTSPVRTGQQVYAKQADLVVLGVVSEGAEIIADGNIHVYAPMRGRALAGESGDTTARIFLQSMQAELVSIAGIYRVFEQNLPPSLHKKAVQIELQDDERLAIFAINAN